MCWVAQRTHSWSSRDPERNHECCNRLEAHALQAKHQFRSDEMFGRKSRVDAQAQIEAIGRSQAMIEFNLDGTIITANKNFLDALGYRLPQPPGNAHSKLLARDHRR